MSCSAEELLVTFVLDWELNEYIELELEGDRNYRTCVTLTGSGERTIATSCEEYLTSNWPSTSPEVLRCIDSALQIQTEGMLSSFYSEHH